jgi:Translation initiation factor IF-2, N-terminal region
MEPTCWRLTILFAFLDDSGSMTVSELAELIDEKPISVIKFLMSDLGIMASMTRSLDPQTIAAVVEGYGLIVAGSDDDDYDDDEYVFLLNL